MASAWRNLAHYAVYVGKIGTVCLNDFGSNAFVRLDPSQERIDTLTLPSLGSEVSQIQAGRTGEVWEASLEQTSSSLFEPPISKMTCNTLRFAVIA